MSIPEFANYYTSDSDENPGQCRESMIITTDSIEEFSHEMSSSLDETRIVKDINNRTSNICEIKDEIIDIDSDVKNLKISDSFSSDKDISTTATTVETAVETTATSKIIDDNKEQQDQQRIQQQQIDISSDYLHNPEWLNKNRHVFILSTAGKPIYSLHGNEDKLASLFGVMQALVSFVQSNQDAIKSIHANGIKFVFLVRTPLILVCVSRTSTSVQQIQMQLTDVYNQILSTLTLSSVTNIYEKRSNFDFRRLLGGSERLIDHLLNDDNFSSNNPFMFLTHSVRILPMAPNIRDNITSAIQNNCCKIKDLVFAMLIAGNKLITLVRMKKFYIHPADLRIIFNLVECSESFKTAESWTPICLPKFDSKGYLHTHISYLSEDCQACLLLLSVKQDVFFTLSDAKKKITEKLRRSNCLESINEAMNSKGINLKTIGIPEIRHFLYKCKSNAQLLCSEIAIPYNNPVEFERLTTLYYNIHHRLHNTARPLKLIYEMKEKEIMLAWVTAGYELFVTFEPFIDKNTVITLVSKLLKWIKKEENVLFILDAPHF